MHQLHTMIVLHGNPELTHKTCFRTHPDQLRETLARNIRLLRARKGMSQEALAFDSGINRTYVSDVERGIRNISLDNISRLAKALGVPAWSLLKEDKAALLVRCRAGPGLIHRHHTERASRATWAGPILSADRLGCRLRPSRVGSP